MAHPYLALRLDRNVLVSHYIVTGGKNPLPLGMGSVKDDQMAAAMIDRLVHHGHLILFEGHSYRMEHALMKQTARQPGAGAVSRDSTLDAKRPGSP